MSRTEAFADRVSTRVARNLSTEPAEALTGVEVVAILSAIIAACDELNPGWRDQLLGLLDRILPPWGARARANKVARRQARFAADLRERARLALDPDSAGRFGRDRARRDQLIVANATRNRVQSLRDGTGKLILPTSTVAAAILEEAATADDGTIVGVVEELAPKS